MRTGECLSNAVFDILSGGNLNFLSDDLFSFSNDYFDDENGVIHIFVSYE